MRARICATALAIAAIAAAGCGGSSGDKPAKPGLTAAQAQSLAATLEQARQAGTGRDLNRTLQLLSGFRATVVRLRRAGALDDATARSLRLGAARAEARARTELAPPPQPAVTQPAPPPKGKANEKPKDEKKHGKGHGKEGD